MNSLLKLIFIIKTLEVMREKFWLESCSAFVVVVACFLLFRNFVVVFLCPIVFCYVVLILLPFQFLLILPICPSSRLTPVLFIFHSKMEKLRGLSCAAERGICYYLSRTVFFIKNLRLGTHVKLSNLHPSV